MCNTVNAPSAEACTYCGYLFEDYTQPNAPLPRREPASVPAPSSSFPSPSPSYPPSEPLSPPQPSTTSTSNFPSSASSSSSSEPAFVVSNMLTDRRVLSSLIVSLVLGTFFVLINLSVFNLFAIAFSLIFFVPAAVTIYRSATQGRRYEFYEDSFRVTERHGATKEVSYSDVSGVDAATQGRSGRIRIALRGSNEHFIVPGDPVSRARKTDLFSFLKQKTSPQGEQQSTSDEEEEETQQEKEEEEESTTTSPV